jgi:hypothetical protein
MARRPTQQEVFDQLLDRYGPEIAAAFEQAIADLTRAADLQRLSTAISAGNLDGVMAALSLDAGAYSALLEAVRATYMAGGDAGVATFPRARNPDGVALLVRFNGRAPRAEQWLANQSADLVSRILEDQRQSLRQAMTAGLERGENPTRTALDIVGRLDRATGKREGGIVGLTAAQEGFVENARTELASGEPEALRRYLSRVRRDKRFDKAVQKAIAAETPLPAETQDKALAQYKNRLLKLRGDMIGRTEALTALRAAKHESYLQAVDAGTIAESDIRRTWKSAGDLRVRHTHIGLNGDTVGLREPFRSPSGARLMYPGDTSLGAPASEIVACRCDVNYRVDFLSNLQ